MGWPAISAGFSSHLRKGIAMSKLSNRMTLDMRLAGLVEGTQHQYLRSVRQLTAYYMISPDELSERHVEKYILYIRDELGVARGTFLPAFFGLKFFYVQTLGYDWPLFTKKKSASQTRSGCPTSAATPIAAA
jgi:Phage integrase, N-terminal SAM-like domain